MTTTQLRTTGDDAPGAAADPAADGTHHVVLRTSVRTLLFTLAWACTCNVTLEVLQGGSFARPVLLLLGAVVLWSLLLLAVALSGRLWIPCTLLLVSALGLGIADAMKLHLREEPVYPSDLAFATSPGFLAQMVSPVNLVAIVLVIAALGAAVVVAGRLAARRFSRITRAGSPLAWRRLLAVRVAGVAASAAFLVYASHFNSPGNLLRAAYDGGGSHWTPWFQAGNYQENGFVGGTLYNLRVPAMTRPAGYSPATMRRIVATYTAAAERTNRGRTPHRLDDVNVVVVLSESFSDPTRLRGVSLSEDPIPFTRGLLRRTTSGNLLAHQVGGGTANVEFESLTGMSISQFAPQMTTPYQMLVPRYDSFPSAAQLFTDHAHRALGVHPYSTKLYRRGRDYPVLGFDRLVAEGDMRGAGRIERGHYISDSSAFRRVESEIDSSSTPLFVNLVTMQNHMPYGHQYAHPVPVTGVSGNAAAEAGQYARGLHYSDAALRGFLHRLSRSEEKTVVVFFGDHLPGFWPQSTRSANGDRVMKETPYFIWSNLPQASPVSHTATLSPIYLLPRALDTVGAPLPPYYALLDEMSRQIPGMDLGSYVDAAGRTVDERGLSPSAHRLLQDYRLVQYDLSVGKRYAAEAMFDVPGD